MKSRPSRLSHDQGGVVNHAIIPRMPGKPKTPNPNGRKGDPVSIAPLTMDQFVDEIFEIKPADVKRIVASKPGK